MRFNSGDGTSIYGCECTFQTPTFYQHGWSLCICVFSKFSVLSCHFHWQKPGLHLATYVKHDISARLGFQFMLITSHYFTVLSVVVKCCILLFLSLCVLSISWCFRRCVTFHNGSVSPTLQFSWIRLEVQRDVGNRFVISDYPDAHLCWHPWCYLLSLSVFAACILYGISVKSNIKCRAEIEMRVLRFECVLL